MLLMDVVDGCCLMDVFFVLLEHSFYFLLTLFFFLFDICF